MYAAIFRIINGFIVILKWTTVRCGLAAPPLQKKLIYCLIVPPVLRRFAMSEVHAVDKARAVTGGDVKTKHHLFDHIMHYTANARLGMSNCNMEHCILLSHESFVIKLNHIERYVCIHCVE